MAGSTWTGETEAISEIKEGIEKMGGITKKLTKITKYRTKDCLESKIIDKASG
ncbi:hypothetical protein PITCH_A1670024 [uncultured Desulfobacterium sp.]|uniref:Uncharacterized protein n=1 Tax=uncultured Desulfobacterium sp. TaxID=201089 RepID=A0A445MUP5_9BACT|nr:hypothetical protein PITCH_A1670024 [uncultured Desulfobacterium sp.]